MSELSPDAKNLLDLARDADEMPAGDKSRHRAQLLAQIAVVGAATAGASLVSKAAVAKGASAATAGVGAAAGAGASASIPAAATVTATATTVAGASLFTKIVGAVAIAGAVGGGTLGVRAITAPQDHPAVTAPAPAQKPRPTANTAAPTTNPAPITSPVTEPANVPLESARGEEQVAPVVAPTPAKANANANVNGLAKPSASARSLTLESETALLRAAHQAMQSGDAARALALLDEHARSYPRGALVEERGAQRVFALCALGSKARARGEAAIFLAERPNSPLAPRVRAACAE